MTSEQPVHVFPFSDSTKRIYCGNWCEGDGWTVLSEQVTCADCMKRALAMALGVAPPIPRAATPEPPKQPWEWLQL